MADKDDKRALYPALHHMQDDEPRRADQVRTLSSTWAARSSGWSANAFVDPLQTSAPLQHMARPDTTRDEALARELQAKYDGQAGNFGAMNTAGMTVAQAIPPSELPFQCGRCGTTHVVRNVSHGATFACAECGANNQILMEDRRPVVVV